MTDPRPTTEPRPPSAIALDRLMAVINERTTIEPRHRPAIRASLRAYRRAIEAEAAQGAAPLDQHEGGPHQRSSGSDAPLRAKATATFERATPRAEQLVRYVEKMREPDIVRPDEEQAIRNIAALIAEEAATAERERVERLEAALLRLERWAGMPPPQANAEQWRAWWDEGFDLRSTARAALTGGPSDE